MRDSYACSLHDKLWKLLRQLPTGRSGTFVQLQVIGTAAPHLQEGQNIAYRMYHDELPDNSISMHAMYTLLVCKKKQTQQPRFQLCKHNVLACRCMWTRPHCATLYL